jgi:DNA-binding transcriptional ArsR family regulator
MVERSTSLDLAYGALAHPLRRAIVADLGTGQRIVTEIAAPHEVSLAAVSKHVRVLEEAGLVERAIAGREHRLTLNPLPLREASGWLESYRGFWEGRLDALDGLLRRGR